MKQTINVYDFHREFASIRPDNFSRAGLNVLFDYFEEYEESTGEDMELDVIAICCDFTEATWQEIEASYVIDMEDLEDADEERKKQRVIEYLTDEGAFIGETDDSIVYRNH
jgi:hypothetical protein